MLTPHLPLGKVADMSLPRAAHTLSDALLAPALLGGSAYSDLSGDAGDRSASPPSQLGCTQGESPLLVLTPAAAAQMHKYRARSAVNQVVRLRLRPKAALQEKYELEFVAAGSREYGDVEFESAGLQFYLDPMTATLAKGTLIDYVTGMWSSGFRFDAPNSLVRMADSAASAVQSVIESQVNPSLSAHGGAVKLIDVRNGVAYVEFSGGCQGCGLAPVTMKELVFRSITAAVKDVHTVVDATEHSQGTSPYYP